MPIDKNNGALWTLGATAALAVAGLARRGLRGSIAGIPAPVMADKQYHVTSDPHGGRLTHRSPLEWLETKPSVIEGDYVDTTNTGGSWAGWFAQKVGKTVWVIPFQQEFELHGSSGATVFTAQPLFSFPASDLGQSAWRQRALESYVSYFRQFYQ